MVDERISLRFIGFHFHEKSVHEPFSLSFQCSLDERSILFLVRDWKCTRRIWTNEEDGKA